MNILLGDRYSSCSAQAAALAYLTGSFMEQITADGEQPFEVSEVLRIKSFHNRGFNRERASNLGSRFWSAKTCAGSTLQAAALCQGIHEDLGACRPVISCTALIHFSLLRVLIRSSTQSSVNQDCSTQTQL